MARDGMGPSEAARLLVPVSDITRRCATPSMAPRCVRGREQTAIT